MLCGPPHCTGRQNHCNQCHSIIQDQKPPSPCSFPVLLHLVLQTSSFQIPIPPRWSISNYFLIQNLFLLRRTCQCKSSCLGNIIRLCLLKFEFTLNALKLLHVSDGSQGGVDFHAGDLSLHPVPCHQVPGDIETRVAYLEEVRPAGRDILWCWWC